MPRLRVLIGVFVISFLAFVIALMPARVFVPHLPEARLGGAAVAFDQARGRIWDGSLRWQWRDQPGRLAWDLDWRGLAPGVQLELAGSGLDVAGWLGGGSGRVRLVDWRLEIPVALIARFVERGGAEGRVSGRLAELDWHDGAIHALEGRLRWTGGRVSWPPDGAAELPPLDGRLFMEGERARARVQDPRGRTLAGAEVAGGRLKLRVFRAWPMLLGVSQGGQASDVVLEVDRPLPGAKDATDG